ncbi:hypothetical protein EJB05_54668, partial [Eragrostis curvula]
MTNRSPRRKRREAEARTAESQTSPTTASGSPAAAAYPRWVLLYYYGEHVDDDEAFTCSAAEAKTIAAARTAAGLPIHVSFRFAPPPETSRLRVRFPDGAKKKTYLSVMATHGDSVLFQISVEEGRFDDHTVDHLVYNAGVTAGPNPRPPSVSLIPPYYLSDEEVEKTYRYSTTPRRPVHRRLEVGATGILRRGEEDFVVAELKMVVVNDDAPKKKAAELLMLRSGEWTVQRPTVRHITGEEVREPLLSSWKTRAILPVGDKQLCWVDQFRGLMFSNVFDDSPSLQYVAPPVKPYCSNMSVTANGSVVKFVNIFPRCCCGSQGATECHRSSHAYTINTWTLRLDDMAWVMDGMMDSTEVWALDAYNGLPRVHMVCPIVSMEDPHIVCFAVKETYFVQNGDMTEWLIMLNLRSKKLLSACHGRDDEMSGYRFGKHFIPSGISDYFNPYPSSSSSNCTSSMIQSQIGINIVAPEVKESQGNDGGSAQSSWKASVDSAMQASDVLALFQEIPTYGLAEDDVVKAYSILSHDNGHRFKALSELPISLRKDWLLMEIKASEA